MKLFPAQSFRGLATIVVLLTLSFLPLTGCSQDTEVGGTSTRNVDVPPIYVAQTLVLKEAGEPAVERNYRQLLKLCHDASMATTPLNKDDVKKLGRTYYQLWFDDRHSASQEDVWDFGAGDDPSEACQFYIKHEAYKAIVTPKERLSIDLIAKTATSEVDTGFMSGGHEGLDDEVQLDTSANIGGFQRLGYAHDAGQRCLRWRAPKPSSVESCTWSEGRKWGFGSGPGGYQATGAYDASSIVLWVHPANGTGGELTTQKMTVGGEPFDDAVFAPPSGVSIKKSGS